MLTPLRRDDQNEAGVRRCHRSLVAGLAILALMASACSAPRSEAQSPDPRPPRQTVKLVFVHHSCGENWLADANGGLGRALAANRYFVSDTNYGWGPNGIGDRTDITDWPEWFTGPRSGNSLRALYRESGQHCDYTRSLRDPGGENRIVLFKSCFPNSNLEGRATDRPARGDGLTVANAKAIYIELLRYFATRPDKLFVAITAPPVQDRTHAANARAFNTWLVRDWLANYRGKNVAVFDFYNVLTSPGNHHRLRSGRIEHLAQPGRNTLYYPSNGDDHPSRTGNRKATDEFLPLLNAYCNRWMATAPEPRPASEPPIETPPEVEEPPTPAETQPEVEKPPTARPGRILDDFERRSDAWAAFLDEASGTRLTFSRNRAVKHGGAASLGIRYDVAAESWATCSRVYDQPRDWSPFQGLSLYLHAEKLGQPITIVAYGGKSSDDLLHFEYRLRAPQAAVGGWQRIDIRWQQLKPASWQGDGSEKFDPRSAMGIALAFEASDSGRNTGRLWIDDVTLLSDRPEEEVPTNSTENAPPPEPPAEPIEEPAPPAEPTEEPPRPGEPSTPAPTSTQRLEPADLVYRGAFRLPDGPPEIGWEWSGEGLAYCPQGDPDGPDDGHPGSLFGTGHNWNQHVSEIGIPRPVISATKNLRDLNTARTLQPFADVAGDLSRPMEQARAGLAYLERQGRQTGGKLYFCRAPHLDEGATAPSHGWCEPDLSNPRPAGPWAVANAWNYVTTDYLFDIPRAWADRYTAGRCLATGRFRDGGQGSQGPSLFAIAPWLKGNPPPKGTRLKAVALLRYSAVTDEPQVTLRNYHHADDWSGAAWLTAGNQSAVVFAGTKGEGRCWYGFSNGLVWPDEPPYPPVPDYPHDQRGWWSERFVGQILFYDPADLAAVAAGARKPHEPQPYATMAIDEHLFNVGSQRQTRHVGAIACDRRHGYLYVLEFRGDGDKSLVHVWQVRP